jgi:hypothetical protein
MGGWDFDSSSGKNVEFTKFPEGITKIRIVDDAPHIRWTHWLNQQKRSVNCPGKGCPICEVRKSQKAKKEPYTYNMGRRFSMQVLNRNTGKLELMEQGINFFEDLKDLRETLEDKDLTFLDVDIAVKRRGTGKDGTSYRLDIDEKYPLSEEDKKLISEKLDLNNYFKPHDPDKILRVLNGEEWKDVMYESTDDEGEEFEVE